MYRIHRKLILWLTLVVSLTVAISSVGLLFYLYHSIEKELDAQMERFMILSKEGLSTALWQYNYPFALDFIDSLFLSADVAMVRVETEKGVVGERYGTALVQRRDFSSLDHKQYLIRESEISYGEHLVGKITVALSREREREQLLASGFVVIFLLVLVLLVISTTIYILSKIYIFEPLQSLERSAMHIGSGNLNTQIEVVSNDEIGHLAETFRHMTQELKSITASRDELNNEIEARISVERALLERERELATLMDNLPGMVYRCENNTEWTMRFVSSGCEPLTGYAADQLKDDRVISYADLIHPEDREMVWTEVQRALNKKRSFQLSYRILTADKVLKWVWEQGIGILDEKGDLCMLEGFIADITERKMAEEALELTQFSIDNSSEAAFWLDSSGRFSYVNRAACESLGYSEDELLALGVYDISPRVPQRQWSQRWEKLKRLGKSRFESNHRTKDGQLFPVEITTSFLDFHGKEYICAFARDLTERVEAEKSLRESEARFRSLFEQAAVGVALLESSTGKFIRLNKRYCDILGYVADELEGKRYQDFIFSKDLASNTEKLSQLIRGELREYSLEKRYLRKNGELVWVNLTVSSLWEEGGDADHHIAIVEDITHRKETEMALRRHERVITLNNRIATVFLTTANDKMYNGVLDVILAELDCQYGYFGYLDDDGNLICPSLTDQITMKCEMENKEVVFANHCWAGTWGKSFIRQETLVAHRGLNPPEGHLQISNALSVPIVHMGNLIGQFVVANRAEGFGDEERELLEGVAAQTAPVLAAQREDERQRLERARLEEQYLQAQKLESIGRLAGGVAHDLNNMLSPILGFGEMVLEETDQEDPRHEMMEEIVNAGTRARDMVRQLLAFSRRQTLDFQLLDLNELLVSLERLLRRTITENIEIRMNLAPSLPEIVGDYNQIEQVVMNLVVNAQHAMEQGGTMTISSSVMEVSEHDLNDTEQLVPGAYVVLSVKDTGPGIEQEIVDHIFEPFFTTKDVDEGSGLGLATVYGIVKQHCGIVDARNRSTGGAEFRAFFPVSKEGLQTDGRIPETIVPQANRAGSETILVVEDNPQVSHLVLSILRRRGYATLFAQNGKEALELLDSHDGDVHLLLTDVVMPLMNGKELYEQVRARYPHIRILYMSGYTNQVILKHGVMTDAVNFIQKPFLIDDLTSKIRTILDGRGERLVQAAGEKGLT